MKLVTYEHRGRARAGVVADGRVRDAGDNLHDLHPTSTIFPLGEVRLLPPVPRPGKIICAGLNYRDHAEETGQPVPPAPLLFAKLPSSVVGPDDSICIPSISAQVDYEAELAVVIDRRAHRVSVTNALDIVLGYTCLNDVSARDLQLNDGQWMRGKSLDTFCPLGPWIVTTDEVPNPQALGIRCVVNGRVLQDSSTSEMIFSVAELVSYISSHITLEAGDVIATGTPAGIGLARNPPEFLKAGDVVRVEIDSIGVLENSVTSHP